MLTRPFFSTFPKQGRECFDRRVKNGVNLYCAEAVRLIKNAVVEARTTPESRLNNNVIALAERSKPSWLSWTKDSDNRHSQGGRNVHGTAVVANQQLTLRQYTHEPTQGQRKRGASRIILDGSNLARVPKP